MVLLFTGQPHSGKTTLAKLVKTAIEVSEAHFYHVFLIDGDDIRALFDNQDYSEAGRRKNIETAHNIAKYLHKQSVFNVILVSLVSPYKDLRDKLKSECNAKEIYVHTSAIRGREKFHVENYEKPTENFLDIDTTHDDELTCVNTILKYFLIGN
jgi:adenylylsulfate kinase-like enzyme